VSVTAFLLLCLLLLQAPPRDQPPPPAKAASATAASISGRVYGGAAGIPVWGAVVVLVQGSAADAQSLALSGPAVPRPGGSRPGAVTDATGAFTFPAVPPGDYRLIAAPGSFRGKYLPIGYGAQRANDPGELLTIRAGDHVRGIDITLPPALAVEGRVVDETGEPLARMSVIALRVAPGSETAQRETQNLTLTDDLGRYRIFGLTPGNYLLAAEARSLASALINWADSRIVATLTEREPAAFATTLHPSAVTESSAQRVHLTTNDVSGIDISVVRARRYQVTGMVFDSRGAPASQTAFALIRPGIGASGNISVRTNADGRIPLGALEPGDYRLLIGAGLAPGLGSVNGRTEFAEASFTVAGDLHDLVITTQPGIGVAGRVVFSDGPPPPASSVRLAFRRPEQRYPRNLEIPATLDDEWRFFGSDLFGPLYVRAPSLPKPWVVKAVLLNGTDITDEPISFRPEHAGLLQLVLTSRPSALEGVVQDDSGKPMGDATVYVFGEHPASWTLSSPRTHVIDARENGRFTADGLAAGRYFAIAVAREGFRPPATPGEAFFSLLSKEATPFVVGDNERRTVDLRGWRWPD
jgi:protocatechuate 3,4-dioxygenase beta subunit